MKYLFTIICLLMLSCGDKGTNPTNNNPNNPNPSEPRCKIFYGEYGDFPLGIIWHNQQVVDFCKSKGYEGNFKRWDYPTGHRYAGTAYKIECCHY